MSGCSSYPPSQCGDSTNGTVFLHSNLQVKVLCEFHAGPASLRPVMFFMGDYPLSNKAAGISPVVIVLHEGDI